MLGCYVSPSSQSSLAVWDGRCSDSKLPMSCVLLVCEEDAGRKAMVDDWDTIVERKMDSDSLGDAG